MITTLTIFGMFVFYGRFLIALMTLTVGYRYVFTIKERLKIEQKGGRLIVLPWAWLMLGIACNIIWWYQNV